MIKTEFSLANASISNSENVLENIHQTDKNIAIYEREIGILEPEITEVMNTPVLLQLKGTTSEIEIALADYFNSEFPNCLALLNDIIKLLNSFGKVANSSSYRLLLATVNTNMCKQFHTDINDLRMLCTYSGPGTLWLTDDNINRNLLDRGDENGSIAIDENQIQQVKTGDAIILKGAIYPKAGTKAAVHRSPVVEESGEQRLLLRFDTNDFMNFY